MASPTIDEVCATKKDVSGNDVLCIYARKCSDYLVYRDPARVMAQFADEPVLAGQQRTSLAQLSALRGQISGLIDGWHQSRDRDQQSRAARYDRRVADAIITGFEARVPDALALLAEIRDDIIVERKSIAQTDYLAVAAIAGVLILVVVGIFASLGSIDGQPPHSGLIWTGAAGGVLGAFFSIATGLRSRSILIDLQRWDNRRDAILRMAVGTIAGGVLLSLLLTNMASLSHIDRASLTGTGDVEPVLLAFILGFLGGFSERAVPGLLSRASLSVEDSDDVAAKQARAAGASAAALGSGRKSKPPEPASDDNGPDSGSSARGGKPSRPGPKSRVARTFSETRTDVAKQGLGGSDANKPESKEPEATGAGGSGKTG